MIREPTLWGRRRGVTAVVMLADRIIVFGRDWYAVVVRPP